MKRATLLLFVSFSLLSCERDIINSDPSHLSNFETFWHTMDKHYVFFSEKEVDWNEIYALYAPRFQKATSNEEAMSYYQEIVSMLNDRHISVSNGRDFAVVQDTKPASIQFWRTYLHYDFENIKLLDHLHIAQLPDNVMYMRILSLRPPHWNPSTLVYPIENFHFSNGVIIDLRDCTGGWINGFDVCKLFFKGEQTVLYQKFRNNGNRSSFTKPFPNTMSGTGSVCNTIPLIVLTNSNTYSMGNSIVSILKDMTGCTILGEMSGGGGGAIAQVLLGRGWQFTYTFCKSLNLSMELIEDGIPPDIELELPDEYWVTTHPETGIDPQLEKALEFLSKK